MIRIWIVLAFCLDDSQPYTHWQIDPKDNRIKPVYESAFALKPEYQGSIVTLHQQENDFDEIKKLQVALIETKHILDEAETEVDLEPNHYDLDSDCIKAGRKLPEFDLFQTTVIPPTARNINTKSYFTKCTECPECRSKEDRVRFNSETARTLMPYCSVIVDLPFIMNTFDHLEGVQNAKDFPELAEVALTPVLYFLGNSGEDFSPRSADHESAYKNGNNIDEMGHCITIALSRNYDDWNLFNLASVFWRIKGNPYEAVECARRAYFYAPHNYRDMALVNMANVLHKQGYTQNATVLLHSAIDIYPDYSLNNFALGNMYSVMEDYSEAVEQYSFALRKQPNFEQSFYRRHAVLCQAKLHHKLEKQHESLKRTLDELRKFKEKQDEYRKRMDNLNEKRSPAQVQNENNKRTFIPAELQLHRLLSLETEDNQKCPNSRKGFKHQRLKSKVELNSNVYYEANEEGLAKQVIYYPFIPRYYDYNNPDWPTMDSCDTHVLRIPEWNEYPSSYVNPESRGIPVVSYLSSDLGIPQNQIVDQPWRLPDCTDWEDLDFLRDIDELGGIKYRYQTPMQKPDEYMLRILLYHINNGRVWPDAIGERIYLAIEKAKDGLEERLWPLYNLAGLFWRVNGENVKAIECLRRAYYHAPANHRDVVLVQLSNIMYRLGHLSDSVTLLRKALEFNQREPVSYFTMGTNLVAMKNITGAIEFFNYALFLDPEYIEPFHSLFINKCTLLRQKANKPLPMDTNQDIHMFWEKAWKPSLWTVPQETKADEIEGTEKPRPYVGFRLVKEKEYPNESTEERDLRYQLRHEKFGKMAQQLADESEYQIPIDHIELLLEVIEDELNTKKPKLDRITSLMEVPLRAEEYTDEKLKYQIAKTLLNKLTKVKEFAEGSTKTIFDHLDKAR